MGLSLAGWVCREWVCLACDSSGLPVTKDCSRRHPHLRFVPPLSPRASALTNMFAHAKPCIVPQIIISWSPMRNGIHGQPTTSLHNPGPDGECRHPLSSGRS